jgi:hypothetical protein
MLVAAEEDGLPRRGAGPGWIPRTGMGGDDGGHGPQNTTPTYTVSERESLPEYGALRGRFCFGRRDTRRTSLPRMVRCDYWMKLAISSKESLPPVWRPTYQGECPVGSNVSTAFGGAFRQWMRRTTYGRCRGP